MCFRGFYPKGGGEVRIGIEPLKSISSVNLADFGCINKVWGECFVAGVLPPRVGIKLITVAAPRKF